MRDGWNDGGYPTEGGDCRKLVTLEQQGMIWVGIRAWTGSVWLNNGEPEKAVVIAWRDLPQPAYSDGLMSGMQAPTL